MSTHRPRPRPPGGTAGAGRPRRSCLAVPGSSPRMLEKAQSLATDQVFLDLEDSVAPAAKEPARSNVVTALRDGGWGDRIRVVRVNDWTTEWTYADVITVLEGAGDAIDCIMLPKVEDASHVVALDLLVTQVERALGLEVGRIGLELQIESASGLERAAEIAAASQRTETLVLGPGDLMASLGMPSLVIGAGPPEYDGDALHYMLMRILVAARMHGLQPIDGPYGAIADADGLRATARRAAALGMDGKWVLHPSQVDVVNEAFTPSQDAYERAEDVLAAYAWSTSEAGGSTGAIILGDEMIDEASRRMAEGVAAKGRAAGLTRRTRWTPPTKE